MIARLLILVVLLAASARAEKAPVNPATPPAAEKVSAADLAKYQIAGLKAQVATLTRENALLKLQLAASQEETAKGEAQEAVATLHKSYGLDPKDGWKPDGTIVRAPKPPEKLVKK